MLQLYEYLWISLGVEYLVSYSYLDGGHTSSICKEKSLKGNNLVKKIM